MEKQWYVVHTLTGHENKVKASIEKMAKSADLDQFFGRILVPTEEEVKSTSGKRRVVKKKLFPGYVLIQMSLNNRTGHLVRQTSGVTAFVGSGTKPVPLKPDEVENVLQTVGEEAAVPRLAFDVDEAILVNDGPFAEMSGKITAVDAHREKLTVQISIFGRDTPVELDFTQVDKL
ncbi:MAG: transcription termination/antitermination protein NusG [Armatimonadota bacterium]|jgi:transcriptional antiterminator NusG